MSSSATVASKNLSMMIMGPSGKDARSEAPAAAAAAPIDALKQLLGMLPPNALAENLAKASSVGSAEFYAKQDVDYYSFLKSKLLELCAFCKDSRLTREV